MLRIRGDLFVEFRAENSDRIKHDRNGETSVQTSFKVRVAWARGDWMRICSGVMGALASLPLLRRWEIVKGGFAGRIGGSAGRSDDSVDRFLMETLEALSRNFVGIQARNLMLWSGGIYNSAMLLTGEPADEKAFFDRARLLWIRLQQFEEALCDSASEANIADPAIAAVVAVHADLREFEQGYLWMDGTIYRELLAAAHSGLAEFCRQYAARIHSGVFHEKGSQFNSCT